jgi:hypothetical protein
MPNQLLPINPWAGEMSASYSFTYSFDPEGSIVMTYVPGSFLGTWVSGPNVGTTTTDGPPPRRGKVTPDAKVITLTTYPLIPINQSVDYGCGPDFPAQRFEVQSVTLIWQNDKKY